MTKARITHYHEIIHKEKPIGKIQLVFYGKSKIPHIEYEIDDKHQSKGIMSKELRKYISDRKKEGLNRFIAVIKKENEASIRLMEKNKFIKMTEFDDTNCYFIDLDLWEKTKKAHKEYSKNIESFCKTTLNHIHND